MSLLRRPDSNGEYKCQKLGCYHYTTAQFLSVNKRNNKRYVLAPATGSGLSGVTMATDRKNVAIAFHVARIKLVNVGQKINLASNPRFRVNESTMVNNLSIVAKRLDLCFHSVNGVNVEFHTNSVYREPARTVGLHINHNANIRLIF